MYVNNLCTLTNLFILIRYFDNICAFWLFCVKNEYAKKKIVIWPIWNVWIPKHLRLDTQKHFSVLKGIRNLVVAFTYGTCHSCVCTYFSCAMRDYYGTHF